jgi:hypothetical protein
VKIGLSVKRMPVSSAVAVVIWPAITSSPVPPRRPRRCRRAAIFALRHSNLQTTAIYVQVADGKRVEAIDRLDPLG